MSASSEPKKMNANELKSYLDTISRLCFSQRPDDKTRLLNVFNEILEREEKNFSNSRLAISLRDALRRSQYDLVKLNIDNKMAYQELNLLDLDDLIISEENNTILNRFFKEQKCKDLIKENDLSLSHKIYLYGPPGNGKTSLAGGIAKRLGIPLFVVKLSGIIDSYLGATSRNISQLFEQLKDMECVLLLDELEALMYSRKSLTSDSAGKENTNIVSSLLQCIDKLPDNIILMTATNNAELIDHAVRRRFNYEMHIEKITQKGIEKYIEMFAKKYEKFPIAELVKKNDDVFKSENFAVLENNLLNITKEHLLKNVE